MRTSRAELSLGLILIGLLAVFMVVLWLPHRRHASTMRRQIELREQQIRRIQDENVQRWKRKAHQPDLEDAIPPRADLGSLLETLSESLAAESVEVLQFEAKTVAKGAEFDRIPIALQFRGPYESLFRVLERLESSKRTIRVDRAEITSLSIDGDPDLNAAVELSTFYRPNPESSS